MKLLLLSNSTLPWESYLEWSKDSIIRFMGEKRNILFLPFATTWSFDDYERKVQKSFEWTDLEILSIHHTDDYKKAIKQAEVLFIGWGNTFLLVKRLYDFDLVELIGNRVKNEGLLYIWASAGTNLACPQISTTNDMPIVEPSSFSTFWFLPFQINPHYLDSHPTKHMGETREQRIREFLSVNPEIKVIWLREWTLLERDGNTLFFHGAKTLRLFEFGKEPIEIFEKDVSFLIL